ncbi:MAG TPA: hypothetical protein VI457_12070 [Methylococcaceae bacterium]|nr:hypothetical protein [Methylococcaceae bacterium]
MTCLSDSAAGLSLLRSLQAQGLRLSLEADGRLRVGPSTALTPSLRALIQASKPQLAQALAHTATAAHGPPQGRPCPDPQDVAEFYEERAGILEHDAGLSRHQAETEALRLAVARFQLHPREASGTATTPAQAIAQILADLQARQGQGPALSQPLKQEPKQ